MSAALLYLCHACGYAAIEQQHTDECPSCGATGLHLVSAKYDSEPICEECGNDLACDEFSLCSDCLEVSWHDYEDPYTQGRWAQA